MTRKARLLAWNRRLNDLPRRLALLAVTFGLLALALVLLPYVWPFALALLLARMLEPFVRLLARGRLRRGLSAALGTLLLTAAVLAAVTVLVVMTGRQLTVLAKALPQLFTWINDTAIPAVESLYQRYRDILPAYLPALLENALSSLGQSAVKLAGSLSAWLTSGAFSTAASIPYVLLSLTLTVMSTYYLCADRARVSGFFARNLPNGLWQRGKLMRRRLGKAVAGQIRSQLVVSLWITLFLTAFLLIFRGWSGLAAGLLIGLADALPVVGAGLFLIPWSLLSFWTGDTATGILTACLYGGSVLIRQVLEPRIVGQHLGLHPLAAMMAMFAGFRLTGILGLIAGPIVLNVAKVVLTVDETAKPGSLT